MSARSRRIPIRRQHYKPIREFSQQTRRAKRGPRITVIPSEVEGNLCTLHLRRARIQEDALSFRAKSRNLLFLSPTTESIQHPVLPMNYLSLKYSSLYPR